MRFQDNILAGIVLNREAMQSEGFSNDPGGITGWRLEKTGDAYFYSVTVGGATYTITSTGDASFENVYSNTDIYIAGESLTDLLDEKPRGCIAIANSENWITDSAATSAATALLVARFDYGPLYSDRIYQYHLEYELVGTVTNDVFRTTVRFTTDGSAPAVGSAIFDGGEMRVTIPAGKRLRIKVLTEWMPIADYAVMKTAVVIQRVSGTGTASIELTDPNTSLRAAVMDVGQRASATANATLMQKSKLVGVPDPDPTVEYRTEYPATWCRTWVSTAGTVWSTDTWMRQGYFADTGGNQVSWIGFDHAQIATDLTGSTVKKVEAYINYPYWYNDTGTAVFGYHWSTAVAAPAYDAAKDNLIEGILSAWPRNVGFWVDISTVGAFTLDGWRTGAHRGLALGPGIDTGHEYAGMMYGVGMSNAPKLRITYEK